MNIKTIEFMKETGGAFEKSIADAWLKADDMNRSKLTSMFPEFEKFKKKNWNLVEGHNFGSCRKFSKEDVKKCRDLILKDFEDLDEQPDRGDVKDIINKRFGELK